MTGQIKKHHKSLVVTIFLLILGATALVFQNCGEVKLAKGTPQASSSCSPNAYSILTSWDANSYVVSYYLLDSNKSQSQEYTGSTKWMINGSPQDGPRPQIALGATPDCSLNLDVESEFIDNCSVTEKIKSDFLDPRCVQPIPTPTPTPPPPAACTTTATHVQDYVGSIIYGPNKPGESTAVKIPIAGSNAYLPLLERITKVSIVETAQSEEGDVQFSVSECPGDFSKSFPCTVHSQYTGGSLNLSIGPKPASTPWYMNICELPVGTQTVYFNFRHIMRPTPVPQDALGTPSCPNQCSNFVQVN